MNSSPKEPETAAEIMASLSAPASNSSALMGQVTTNQVMTVRQFIEHIMPNSNTRIAIAGLALDVRPREAWISHAELVRDQERAVFFAALHRMAQGRNLPLIEESTASMLPRRSHNNQRGGIFSPESKSRNARGPPAAPRRAGGPFP